MEYPYEVFVGDFVLCYSFEMPNEIASVFTEADRKQRQPDLSDPDYDPILGDEPEPYIASVAVMRERLEVMGLTSERWREEMTCFAAKEIESCRDAIEWRTEAGQNVSRRSRKLLILTRSTPERWVRKLLALTTLMWDAGDYIAPDDVLQSAMFDSDTQELFTPFTSPFLLLRAALDVCSDSDTVLFDFANAANEGRVDPSGHLADSAREALLTPARQIEKILILPEGKSDSRLLKRTLEVMFPHLAHMYAFMDHAAFRAEGGVSALVSLARSFAAAGITNRAIFLFDNDTAGLQ